MFSDFSVVCLHTQGELRYFSTLKCAIHHLLVNLVQKLSKLVNICKSYCQTFTGTFFMDHSVVYCKIVVATTVVVVIIINLYFEKIARLFW